MNAMALVGNSILPSYWDSNKRPFSKYQTFLFALSLSGKAATCQSEASGPQRGRVCSTLATHLIPLEAGNKVYEGPASYDPRLYSCSPRAPSSGFNCKGMTSLLHTPVPAPGKQIRVFKANMLSTDRQLPELPSETLSQKIIHTNGYVL